ncbi:glycosyl hydrolase family 43 [Pontibacter diazotrophicus]|uniref:Glycosyl hydrolase family 43 n=1 Tax=Pontibacter diazotrophicus TaxID=1400979 RepID=A0A3D8L6R5_9BACT|nr:glycosyl hydrolase [Pontibacter diazotrophicus]RDV13013.1 glycosyl hydrolase family 43 [Pontibacter diazotrophicus]
MKRRTFLKNTSAAGLLTLITPAGIFQTLRQNPQSGLEESFIRPAASARPHTWWHWMNGNVTKEGITLDLEAMERIGVGGFQNFDAGTGIVEGPVKYLSPEWLELKKHAIREADRLGLEFTMHNCPGWSSSGGPWITPELSMQQFTWSEDSVRGGRRIKRTLPQPFTNLGYYRDVAVVAYPSLQGEAPQQELLKSVTSSSGPVTLKQLTGKGSEGVAVQPGADGQPAYLQFEFRESYEARSLTLVGSPISSGGWGGGQEGDLILEASNDGVRFRQVSPITSAAEMGRSEEEALMFAEFPATSAKYFRLISPKARQYAQVRFSGAPRLEDWMKKANYRFTGDGVTDTPDGRKEMTASSFIDLNRVMDITKYMDKNGQLKWKAPAGNWTILRIGFTSMGTLNRSAPDAGVGLECDKYSAEAIEFHFNKMMEELLPSLHPLATKGKVGLLIDSYEVGMQNWTPGFEQEFRKRMGYDLLKYLPAMTGRVVGSVEETNRFLWDLRRSQADLMADNYYGKFTDLCHQHGIISYSQPYDRGPMEEMQIGARMDINLGEFWNSLSTIFQNNWTMRRTMKLSASIAHVNGQQVIAAESFTGEPESARWQEYPFAMKALGDKKFTEGLNRIVFHRFAHQPHPTAKPGMTMGPWGIHFDRTNTWWEPGKSWISYLTRCQSLLQQGLFVADLAYFTSESPGGYTVVDRSELNPPPPEGYDYDLINAEVIMKRVKVENGHITLPDGMSYRALVLQEPKGITVALLRKLQELVNQGMILIGPKPEYTLGLQGYPDNRSEFDSITANLWGNGSGTTIKHTVGRGRVYWGQPLQTILDALALKPDFQVSSRSGDAPITYIHRHIDGTDIYFLANQRRKQENLVCTFRVKGMQPELWDADTGMMTPVSIYEQIGEQVCVPVQLEPSGSVFVVFRTPAPARHVQAVLKGNTPLLSTKPFPKEPRKLYKDVSGNFTISFWAKPEFNVMLSTQNFMDNIKDPWTDYYSIYPPSGETQYGPGHATAGLAVGRNGVAVWEHGAGKPTLALAAPVSISGWSHVALVYQDNVPSVYVNGKLVEKGKGSGDMVHPGLGQAFLEEGASYYNGDMTEPELLSEAVSEEHIQQLAIQNVPVRQEMPSVEMFGSGKPGLLFWQDGRYTLHDSAGRSINLQVSGLGKQQQLSGPWMVNFPPDLGAPASVTLPQLMSLHQHSQDGVKYFSGTAAYHKTFDVQANNISAVKTRDQRLFLDLGQVEVMAQVLMNGKDLGVLWKRPYRVDVSDTVKAGSNSLEIRVTNLWPNRLIGDEQLPDVNDYTPGAGGSGFASLSGGAIKQLPEWYKEGKPKPDNGRVAFTTWKHYNKDSPLLESGLVGPVVLRTALHKPLADYVLKG